MADQVQSVSDLQAACDALNDALAAAGVTPYKLAVADPKALKEIDKNAHYMPKVLFDRLTENIKRDGNLSTLPFCWRDKDGTDIVLSGNHRVKAAVEARVPLILYLYTDADLSRAQRRAIQLSHNSLIGQDNPTQLVELWEEIDDLSYKVYSGLDDAYLQTLKPIEIERIGDEQLRFETLEILFLPSEIARLDQVLKRLGKSEKPRYAGRVEDFDRFFERLLDFKEASNIRNTGTAILAMLDIVEDWLDDRARAQAEAEREATVA
jgi:hypothetical protein